MKIYFHKNEEELKENLSKLLSGLMMTEKALIARKTAFFFGDIRPGLMDYNLWPIFERMLVLESHLKWIQIPWKGKHPHLVQKDGKKGMI